MRVISKKKLKDHWAAYPQTENSLTAWYRTVKNANWRTFADIRSTYRTADPVGKCVVFNVGGNKIRVIAIVHYGMPKNDRSYTQVKVFIRHVLTHAEYDANGWKGECCG
jgi:mRNA interferase HigB